MREEGYYWVRYLCERDEMLEPEWIVAHYNHGEFYATGGECEIDDHILEIDERRIVRGELRDSFIDGCAACGIGDTGAQIMADNNGY